MKYGFLVHDDIMTNLFFGGVKVLKSTRFFKHIPRFLFISKKNEWIFEFSPYFCYFCIAESHTCASERHERLISNG